MNENKRRKLSGYENRKRREEKLKREAKDENSFLKYLKKLPSNENVNHPSCSSSGAAVTEKGVATELDNVLPDEDNILPEEDNILPEEDNI